MSQEKDPVEIWWIRGRRNGRLEGLLLATTIWLAVGVSFAMWYSQEMDCIPRLHIQE